jgi:hypothetical protein
VLPNPKFTKQPKEFWAHVRSISQTGGYVVKGKKAKNKGQIRVFSIDEICAVLTTLGLSSQHVVKSGTPTTFGLLLVEYFSYRAQVLNSTVEPNLMNAARAMEEFFSLKEKLCPTCPLPMNKQKGKKRSPAYLTGIVNMLVEANAGGLPVNYNPLVLTTVTRNNQPVRTLSRRVDGCFPTPVNPAAVWEVKEYYHTTSFGSRVADGVYETMLDGMELEELRANTDHEVDHLLIVDAYDTWWLKGRSYLCRIIDMLHMGYVTQVLFGHETVQQLPAIVKGWVAKIESAKKSA